MTVTYFTRADYMSSPGPDAHRRYYGQFVTPAVRSFVGKRIGVAKIRSSNDPHFNDIPLAHWDALEPAIRGMCLSIMGDINGSPSADTYGRRNILWSLSDAVCIAKEAAKQIKES